MSWYQNPIIAAVLGGLAGAIITGFISLYTWRKTHKIKRVDGVIGDISSLLTFSDKIRDQLEVKFSGEEVKAVYLFTIDIINSGTEAVETQPVNIRLDNSSKIVDYSITTDPEVGFGDIVEKKKEGNALNLEIELLNPNDRASIEVVSLDNESELINVYLKNANVQSRVYFRKSAEKALHRVLSNTQMLTNAGLLTIPFLGTYVRSMQTIALAKKIDEISNKGST